MENILQKMTKDSKMCLYNLKYVIILWTEGVF